ncbi:MAG: YHYH protein [Crocinitomicaceae bacterium]|nr:YHYH protein [Crocinitomicaceae bacterium]
MSNRAILFLTSIIISLNICAQDPIEGPSTFSIQLTSELCTLDPEYKTIYEENVDLDRRVRIITANGIPSHQTGAFPNAGNPNTIRPQETTYEIPLQPILLENKITAQGKRFGVLFSGVELDPFTAEYFQGTNGSNRDWNITTLTSTVNLGLDCNNAHVQPSGKYHYHGTPNAFLQDLGVDGSKMVKIGYAADGFPIYYKYGMDSNGEIKELKSAYDLKAGERSGDGKTAPNGKYDGTYFQDYEYVEGLSTLDECNGVWGRTPDNENEYYYVITDNFPSSPICFSATPSQDFMTHQGPSQGGNRPPSGDRPNPTEILNKMDGNHDGKISRSEARGPLHDHFDKVDKDGDGFISRSELEQMPPPNRR